MLRREVLLGGSALVTLLTVPRVLAQSRPAAWRNDRTLLLIQLAGGNDGLNTVVPFADPAYPRLRPSIGLKREQVIALDEKLALHPSLKPLMGAWQDRELAIVQGVGYANPNRSHFRSIDIWQTASGSDHYLHDGWIARLLAPSARPRGLLADAIILGGSTGAVEGAGVRSLSMPDPDRFLHQAELMDRRDGQTENPALAHMLRVGRQVQDTAQELKEVLARAPEVGGDFPSGPLGQQLRVAARLLKAGAQVPVIKIAIGSFDTHANQPGQHANLLRQLAEGLAAFRKSMSEGGQWPRILVMTYSEFGRRAAQNGSNGTDHGTAAPQFLLGAAVKGGFYGPAPDLNELAGGDLRYAIDYRSLYATIAGGWWHLGPARDVFGSHYALPILKA